MPIVNSNILDHPIGRLYRLTGFNAHFQRHLVDLIGVYDVRAIVINDAVYVPWSDIEPHSTPADDADEIAECFRQKALPVYDPVSLFEDIHASRDYYIARTRERLANALSDWPQSAPQTNPFQRTIDAGAVWRDIAFVACHQAPSRRASCLVAAYDNFLVSFSSGCANDVGLLPFFRCLFDVAEIDGPIGLDPFIQLWAHNGFAMPTTTTQTLSVAAALHRLVRAQHGWRGDPHGSHCPGSLMKQCIGLLRPICVNVL